MNRWQRTPPVLLAGLIAALPGPLFLALASSAPASWFTPLAVVAQAAGPAILTPAWIPILAARSVKPALITAIVWGLVASQAMVYAFLRTH